ncbi:aminoacyl-tRNA hydrolase [Notoacmeibacter sp. MSK16QG-6]|uniref:aminoacyl-tRNA hydrolase n=1 Tax=Notoacmeibacter sp. MSK16QG-6 TaxID=2957982 RepID=UPI00209D3A51|nr:aminoacyl-tRNA hydrolase [Notoacmeibacter sp. MSK16QG-6]MCP1199872.1 aminoacyl-tRNA hydrolase [Notoacmeibacter sp. MSK16QG-6]
MLLIVGLGNPGGKYADNRHNVGFMAADAIARRHNFGPFSKKFQGEVAEGRLGGDKALILKPQTYMNESGRAVGEAMRFYKLTPADLLVLYDELDLVPGKVRVKTGGGAGGHNGIRSIDAHCGKDYRRVRIGIGHPGDKSRVTGHVLGDFAKADGEWLEPLLDAIANAMPMLAEGKDSDFMNKVSLTMQGKVPAQKEKPASAKPAASKSGGAAPTKKPAAKGKSHIHQARQNGPSIAPPTTGPMAEMLKKLLGKG